MQLSASQAMMKQAMIHDDVHASLPFAWNVLGLNTGDIHVCVYVYIVDGTPSDHTPESHEGVSRGRATNGLSQPSSLVTPALNQPRLSATSLTRPNTHPLTWEPEPQPQTPSAP